MVNIYLSVNNAYQNGATSNGDDLLVVPVIPATIKVNKPQNLLEFETVSLKKLAFIAPADLKTIEWESFFPCRDYPYVRGERLRAFDYVYRIDTWIINKTPIRLVVTGLDDDNPEAIFMPCAVENFSYEVGPDGDLSYSISFKEYPVEAGESEDNIMSKEYDELKAMIDTNTQNLNSMRDGYTNTDSMGSYAKPLIDYLLEKGYIRGEGQWVVDEQTGESVLKATGNLQLTDSTLKALIISARAGAFGEEARQIQEAADNGGLID